MEAVKGRRLLSYVLLLQVFSLVSSAYKAPKVAFEIFSPRGFRASIPDDSGITYFAFNANVNRPINKNQIGSINGMALEPTNGRWEFVDTETELKIGDVINYYIKLDIFMKSIGVYYVKDNLSYTVTSFVTSGTESTYTESTITEPTNTDPTNTESTYTELIYLTPTNTEATNTEPEYTELTNTEPTNTEPTNTEPTNIEQTNIEPTYTKPTNTKPTITRPTNTKPTNTRPTNTRPTNTRPTNTRPTNTRPTNTRPTTTKPINTRPTNKKTTNTNPTNCLPTITEVRGGKACGGQIIFEDDFDSLRQDVWQMEQYLPVSWHPEYPFVSYQKLPSNAVVSVSDGYLRITPKLQQNIPGFTNESIFLGKLNLFSGCTSRAEECYRQASGPDILPPVVSGRLTSSGFAFKYGIVKVRAKLPQGDWLYPEILLEPFLKIYGSSNYASGILKIATARGNKKLRVGTQEFGNSVLYGGPIMDVQCRMQLMSWRRNNGGAWGDRFYEYSVTWTPQYIALSVDGEEWSRVYATGGLSERFPHTCTHLPRALLETGTDVAPFDDYFYITLGVAAGGITEFPDYSFSAKASKPWRNSARKGMLNFWEHLSSWHPTWTQPEMLVDYVRVIAL